MDEAELCTVAFIHGGKIVQVDSPQNFKKNFPFTVLEMQGKVMDPYALQRITGIQDCYFFGDRYHLILEKNINIKDLGLSLEGLGVEVEALKVIQPSMDDVFVSLAENEVV